MTNEADDKKRIQQLETRVDRIEKSLAETQDLTREILQILHEGMTKADERNQQN